MSDPVNVTVLSASEFATRKFNLLYATKIKRAFDCITAAMMLFLAAPVIFVLLIIIALDGANPIFAQPRVGKGGRVFACFKLRTMVPDAAQRLAELLRKDPVARREWDENFKLEDDPRITWIGRFLRRTSLDELPQLWNVVRGDMSLVGPRPVTRIEMHRYATNALTYKSMRPGLTGLWQVEGRGRDVSYPERVAMDVRYAGSVSLVEDLRIMVGTLGAVLGQRGR
ncbi:MAG: sugar transferase [Pseudomonadota bacterium]